MIKFQFYAILYQELYKFWMLDAALLSALLDLSMHQFFLPSL